MNLNQSKEIEQLVLEGVVRRASALAAVFGIGFAVYGWTSLEFLRQYLPQISFWENLYPRLILNTLPLFLLSSWFRNFLQQTRLKAWVWSIAWPLVFVLACYIHVMGVMNSGDTSIYLYVHAADIVVVALSLIMTAPPPRLLIASLVCLILAFGLPSAYALFNGHNYVLLRFFIKDMVLFLSLLSVSSYLTHRLQLRLIQAENAHRVFLETELASRTSQLRQKTQEAMSLKISAAIGEMATQVAHDIRSPLGVLRVLVGNQSSSDFYEASLMKQSIERIEGVVSSLLKKHWHSKHPYSISENELNTIGLTSSQILEAIRSIVAEKKVQIGTHKKIEFSIKTTDLKLTAKTSLSLVDLNRMMSNLLDNSIEAIEKSGMIEIQISTDSHFLQIEIQDSGKGIPSEIFNQLSTRGFSYGKKEGSGLGLYHARTTVENAGGRMRIESEPYQGTCLSLYFPLF